MEFRVPTIEMMQQIRNALKYNKKPGCEMSAGNTVLWAKHYKTEIAFWNEEIIFRSHRENGMYSYSYNLISSNNPKALFDKVAELAQTSGHPLRLHCILKEEFQMIEEWYPGKYNATFIREDSDYIYLREQLASLSGKKLHGKRNHIHRFEENYPDWCYESITSANEEECVRMAMEWCMQNCVDEEKNVEYDKIDESKLVVFAIRHREELGMQGGALRAGGRIVAVTLGERLTSDIFVVHFEKAFSDIQGAYPMINREFVRNEMAEYTYVNREEDLGHEGLRQAKMSYRPEILLDKAVVTEQED